MPSQSSGCDCSTAPQINLTLLGLLPSIHLHSVPPAIIFVQYRLTTALAPPAILATLFLQAKVRFRASYLPSAGKLLNLRLNPQRTTPRRVTFARPVTATKEKERKI